MKPLHDNELALIHGGDASFEFPVQLGNLAQKLGESLDYSLKFCTNFRTDFARAFSYIGAGIGYCIKIPSLDPFYGPKLILKGIGYILNGFPLNENVLPS